MEHESFRTPSSERCRPLPRGKAIVDRLDGRSAPGIHPILHRHNHIGMQLLWIHYRPPAWFRDGILCGPQVAIYYIPDIIS